MKGENFFEEEERRIQEKPIGEGVGREGTGLPVDLSPEGFHEAREEEDPEAHLREFERKHKERTGTAFISAEEIPDEENGSGDLTDEEFNELLYGDTEETKSFGRRHTPYPIRQIGRKYALSKEEWDKLAPEEQIERKSALKKEIERYYLTHSSSGISTGEKKEPKELFRNKIHKAA